MTQDHAENEVLREGRCTADGGTSFEEASPGQTHRAAAEWLLTGTQPPPGVNGNALELDAADMGAKHCKDTKRQ